MVANGIVFVAGLGPEQALTVWACQDGYPSYQKQLPVCDNTTALIGCTPSALASAPTSAGGAIVLTLIATLQSMFAGYDCSQ